MKLRRVRHYIPKWNGNRDLPESQRGWVDFVLSHPVEEIEAARDVDDGNKSAIEYAREAVRKVSAALKAVGGWQDDDGKEVTDLGDFLKACDAELFHEIQMAIGGRSKDDEDEIKN